MTQAKSRRAPNAGAPLPERVQVALRNLVSEHGEAYVVRMLELNRQTLARGAAGFGMQRATHTHVCECLERAGVRV